MLHIDYHTHTVYSHGKGTVEENVQAAITAGVPCIGIAEHGAGHVFYGVRGEKLEQLRRDVEETDRRHKGKVQVLYGIEANLTGDGKTDLPPNAANRFDFILLGYHRGVLPRDGISCRWTLSQVLPFLCPEPVKNALAVCHAIERLEKLLCIVHPGEYIPVDIATLAKCAAEHGVALEINARHLTMSVEQLRIAAEQGASFLVGSDAHSPGRVGDVMPAVEHARKAGVLERVLNWTE